MKIRKWLLTLSTTKKVLIITALVLLVTGTGAGAWYYSRLSNLEKMFPEVTLPAVQFPNSQSSKDSGPEDIRGAFANNTLNILLMGFDRDEARDERYVVYRPDTIMIASINLDTGKVNVVSIPRDTLVPIYNLEGSMDKINSAYTYGWKYGGVPENEPEERHRVALKYQVETVSQALKGVPIHYYMTIDMDGVVEAVDTVGGIWYDVEKHIYDKSGKIIVEPGRQLLDGDTFLRFVRNRNYRQGDLQRIKNQQSIMLAAFMQFKNAGTLLHAPQIYTDLHSRIETNLSLEQMLSLALFASQKIDKGKIETHILSASFANGRLHESWSKSYSYLIVNQQKRADLIYEVWGVNVTPDATDKILPPLPREEPKPEDEEDSPLVPVEGEGQEESDPPQDQEPEPGDGEEDSDLSEDEEQDPKEDPVEGDA